MTEQLTLSLNVCMKSAERVDKAFSPPPKKSNPVTHEVIDVFIDLIVM